MGLSEPAWKAICAMLIQSHAFSNRLTGEAAQESAQACMLISSHLTACGLGRSQAKRQRSIYAELFAKVEIHSTLPFACPMTADVSFVFFIMFAIQCLLWLHNLVPSYVTLGADFMTYYVYSDDHFVFMGAFHVS